MDVRFDDNLHDISLQGPLAVDFLDQQGVPGIRDQVYFSHQHTMLWDCPVTISRTGYTGERGYEFFCRGQDAPLIWDNLVEKVPPWALSQHGSPRSICCGRKVVYCFSLTTILKCTRSRMEKAAIRYGAGA